MLLRAGPEDTGSYTLQSTGPVPFRLLNTSVFRPSFPGTRTTIQISFLHLTLNSGTIPRFHEMTTSPQVASHLLRSRLGKICVAITGSTPAEMLETATDVLQETSFLEFRLDYLPDPTAALPQLQQFLADRGALTAIATCRCKENGGRYEGNSQQALGVLLAAAAAGFPLVDMELESVEKLSAKPNGKPPSASTESSEPLAQLRAAGAAVIVSFHDFQGTRELDAVYKRMEPFDPDFMKVVTTANSLADNVTLMRFLGRMEDRAHDNLVGICMGEAGVISRVLGLRAGSAFTFAAAHAGEETAAGQIAARTLIETYRIEQVDASTKVYGVAGNPIGSSLSPVMMNAAFRRETVNAVYLGLQTGKADDLFQLVREVPVQGLSVTMPLKRDVMPLLARTDAISTRIGAVNTIMRMPDGKFYGFNTDVAGIVVPLERRMSLKGAKVLVLGAGGAARAAVFGCRDKGADVWILNRTPETAQKLARQAQARTIKREAVAKMGFDIVINATPAGMAGQNIAPLLGPEDLNARIVFDLVYNPLETPLLQMARAKGLTAISGVEMFVEQGAEQFQLWTNKPAPKDEMLRAVLHALRPVAEPSRDVHQPAATPSAPTPAPAPPPATSSADIPVQADPGPATRKTSGSAPATELGPPSKPAQAAPPAKAAAQAGAKPAAKPAAERPRLPAPPSQPARTTPAKAVPAPTKAAGKAPTKIVTKPNGKAPAKAPKPAGKAPKPAGRSR